MSSFLGESELHIPAISHHFKSIFMLSIIIPIGLFASLKLAGFLDTSVTIAETATLTLVNWEIPRPTQSMTISDVLEAPYANDGLSTTFSIIFGTFQESPMSHDDNDYLRMMLEINLIAVEPGAFIEGVSVVFHQDCQPSLVDWISTDINFENLSLLTVSSGWTYGENFKEATVELAGANHPRSANFSATVEWSLLTSNTETHQMEIAFELTYYNGTVYKAIIQPFQLRLYTGYHYLNVDAGALNIGETSVMVLFDGVTYSTPFNIIVSEGVHRLEFEPVVSINSTIYDFDFLAALYGSLQLIEGSAESCNVTLKITGDTYLRAFY